MSQTARLLRWTQSSISFWKRADSKIPREIEIGLLFNNINSKPSLQAQIDQAKRLDDALEIQVKQRRMREILQNYSEWVYKYWGLIDVESNRLLVWNVINYFVMGSMLVQLLFILLYDLIVPQDSQFANFNDVIRYLVLVTFVLDMLFVRYRVPILINAKFQKQPSKLLILYLKRLFFPDLLTIVLPMIKVDDVDWRWQYLRVLLFLKYLTGNQIDIQIRYKLIPKHFLLVIYSFFKFILGLIFWTTLYACIYLIIDFNFLRQQDYYYQNGLLWLNGSPSLDLLNLYEEFTLKVWFQYALFCILETMRGCGYGVATARNPPEVLFTNCSILTLMAIFAYFTKRIIDISVRYSIETQELLISASSNLCNLQHNYQISQTNRLKYLDQVIENEKKGQKVLQSLADLHFSEDLKHKFMYHFRIHFIFASQLLAQISDNQQGEIFRLELCQVVYQKKSYKGEYLYKSGLICEQILYLSEEARVSAENKSLGIFSKNRSWQFSGIRQFFIDKRPIFDVICLSTLKLYYIKRQEFWQIVKKYRIVFESYCQQMDSIIINRESTQKLRISCWLCKKYHLFEDCLLFAAYRKEVLMLKQKRQQQPSSDCLRIAFKRKNCASSKMRVSLDILNKDAYYPSMEYFVGHNI